ncbi:MAG: HyaD/HybD family hydrogenase maturation endopeptidase [Planctomycetes bacterium]|nr:HyaD/HybD family hydrogenase maturation endopeptidase [Planctomycetota bacterium]
MERSCGDALRPDPVPARRTRKLILGIGNILLRDEGVGVRVIEALRRRSPVPDVELVDGGTAGFDLVDAIAGREKIVVVDAMDMDEEPGSVRRLDPSELEPGGDRPLSLHEFGLLDTLHLAGRLGCSPAEVVIFGVQPADLSTGLELSPQVAAAVERVSSMVISEIGR